MKIIAVYGSADKQGKSASVANEVVRGAQDAGHEVTQCFVNDMLIRGCQGCMGCRQGNCDCVYEDDLKPYWEKLHEADALILSGPNHAGQICGPMITYMNRHYCLLDSDWKPRIHPGIKVVGVFSQGQPSEEAYRQVYDKYLADFENRKMVVDSVLIAAGREPLVAGDGLLQKAYEVGKNL